MTTIPARADGEPRMQIPQPNRSERYTQLDSELFRFALVDKDLTANRFAPTVVVTLESKPGNDDPQQVLDDNRGNLVSLGGAQGLKTGPMSCAGSLAETVDYTGDPQGARVPARPITMLAAAVMHTADATYLATVAIQSTDADNPTYKHDRDAILGGFRFLPPSDTTTT